MNPGETAGREDAGQFHTTRWTRVLAAKGGESGSRDALEELCDAYYLPVHEFLRHTVRDIPEDGVRDLTHAFFARLLGRPGLDSLQRGRGKFRSYLLGAAKHFLADWRAERSAAKRGGGKEPVSLHLETGGGAFAESGMTTPAASDAVYDRAWAMAVLGRGLDRLAEELDEAGRSGHFETLKPWLTGDVPTISQAEAAARLGISEGAVKVAVHRLRKRFRAIVKSEIAQTVASETEVGEELNYLIEALSA